MIISCFQIQLYKSLYECGVVDLYDFHQKFLVSPIELADIIRTEVGKGFVQLNADKTAVYLTEYGAKWLEANRNRIFTEERDMPWKDLPDDMKGEGNDLFDVLFNGCDLQHLVDNLEMKKGGNEN